MQGSKEMWRLVSCSLFLLLLCGLDALIHRDKFLYSGFRGRSKMPPLVSMTAVDKGECALMCAQLAACKSFSFLTGSEGCNLFPRRIMALDVDLSVPSEDAHFSRVFASCPTEKGYVILPGTTKCIRVGNVLKTWAEAADVCAEDGGHLFIIENDGVLQKLTDFLSEDFHYVGYNDMDTEDQYLWLDGTPVNRNMFYPTQPSDWEWQGDEDCGMVSTRRGVDVGLHDEVCERVHTFVCSIATEG